ncbi:MAG TPA: prolipoprotein diacylglyceryl transferase [Candidatus Limnocylindrales bacterium]
MLDFTPPSVAFSIGPLNVYFYGLCYALGLVLAGWVINREAARRGLATEELPNGMIVVAVAAVIGGRLYHVIDQWQLYKDDLLKIVLPPYTGLGAYGGIIVGTIVGILYVRWRRQSILAWADAIAPGLFAMQFVARWGNFFNQELYGPPTSLPWGIPIECSKRVAEFACPPGNAPSLAGTFGLTPATAHFQPMFLYESLSGLLGMLALIWLARRFASRLRSGDLLLVFFTWYGVVRFLLEYMRAGYNWTFFGIPTAQLVAGAFIVGSIVVLLYRHRPGAPGGRPDRDASATAAADTAMRTTGEAGRGG